MTCPRPDRSTNIVMPRGPTVSTGKLVGAISVRLVPYAPVWPRTRTDR